MPHHVKLRPVKLREWSDRDGCELSRVVGYCAACSCGWKGKRRSTLTSARLDLASHRERFGR